MVLLRRVLSWVTCTVRLLGSISVVKWSLVILMLVMLKRKKITL